MVKIEDQSTMRERCESFNLSCLVRICTQTQWDPPLLQPNSSDPKTNMRTFNNDAPFLIECFSQCSKFISQEILHLIVLTTKKLFEIQL